MSELVFRIDNLLKEAQVQLFSISRPTRRVSIARQNIVAARHYLRKLHARLVEYELKLKLYEVKQ